MSAAKKLEVHEHVFLSGPRAYQHLVHSHDGGDAQHEHESEHEDTGPASYTIDKDEWFAKTGLCGGGRKKFTKAPTGPQVTVRTLAPGALDFDVIIVGDGGAAASGGSTGAGIGPIARMESVFGARVRRVEHRR